MTETMLPVDMAQELILSEQELANLTKGGVVRRQTEVRNGRKLIVYPRSATVRAYIMHLKSPALEAQRQYVLEKGATQQIIRSHKELELAKARGEMIDGTLIDREVMGVLSSIKNHMRALPSRISSLLIGKSRAEIRAIVKKYVDLALREASDFDPKRLRGANGQHKRATRRRI